MSSDITESFVPDHSSNVVQCWYNRETQQLYVEFKGGRKYRYDSVQETTWAALHFVESVGKFLNENIIGVYPTERV